jgi:hypothetical protein
MKIRSFIYAFLVIAFSALPAIGATDVIGFYGWGDNFWNSSSGVDQIAAQARRIPGVTSVQVMNWHETQRAANLIMSKPRSHRIVLYGYSCGANSISTIAYGLNAAHRALDIAGIQPSVWCGGHPITRNVHHAWQVYSGCIRTLGLGCRRYRHAEGNNVTEIEAVHRWQSHFWVDTDPDVQRDVLTVIAGRARMLARHGHAVEIVRARGQPL